MTDHQWNDLLRILDGEILKPLPVGFLVDGPWFSTVAGASLMEYFTDGDLWLRANLEAPRRFPEILWLPGFWAEFGMISNPPSFGTKCIWPEDGFPTCEPILRDGGEIAALSQPNVRTDGLLPFLIQRLERHQPDIEKAGHRYRFAASHGPFTIASYLLGFTEFFFGIADDPQAIHELLRKVTRFITDWIKYQKEKFPSIDGILILDDLIGFVGEKDFEEFAQPLLTEIFSCLDVSVRFLHNDAAGLITAAHLEAMGVNLFNFSFEHNINEIRALAGDRVTLLGNIPPRDVLGAGSPDDVRRSVTGLLDAVDDKRRLILSGGGFTPGSFTAEKIAAFREAALRHPR